MPIKLKMKKLLFLLLVCSVGVYGQEDQQIPCVRRYFGESSFVCVCNATYCDNLPDFEAPSIGYYAKITSDISQNRFKWEEDLFDIAVAPPGDDVVSFSVNRDERQSILGFGGAVTDSAALNVLSLSEGAQEQLLNSYYSTRGLEYTVSRINIGGCDFSSRGYTYADTEGDVNLDSFALQQEDLEQKIPILQRISKISPHQMVTIGAAWSAPAWMKTNGNLIGFGQLKDEYYQTWAEYHVKFLDAYAEHNITIWGMSAQNEPLDGELPGFSFNCMGWTPEQQRKFIGQNLGPLLEERGYGDLKLMTMDDQRINLPSWPEKVFNDSEAYKYVDGIAVHWYMDFVTSSHKLSETHDLWPEKFILYTEACEGDGLLERAVIMGSWERMEHYARDIIEDLNNWVVGWVDWNIALDMEGGPNWCQNFVDSPIIVDATKDEFYKNPMFYAMGHFSKYIKRGAVHLSVSYGSEYDGGLAVTAFKNPDDTHALVVLNDHDTDEKVQISVPGLGFIQTVIAARSIVTFYYQQ